MVEGDKASKDVISHIQFTFLKEDLIMTVGAAKTEGVKRGLKWFMEKREGGASRKGFNIAYCSWLYDNHQLLERS